MQVNLWTRVLLAFVVVSSAALAQSSEPCKLCGSRCREKRVSHKDDENVPSKSSMTETTTSMGGLVGAPRSETSQGRLRVFWDSAIPPMERRLDFDAALAAIRGTDPRPLIVMRECSQCSGEDTANLEKIFKDERTCLAAKWFHCVKLDRRVVEAEHPYHALFCRLKLPHMFVTTWSGDTVIPIKAQESWRNVQGTLLRILALEYRAKPASAIKRWLGVLDEFDKIAIKSKRLIDQIGKVRTKDRKTRSDKSKLKKLTTELASLQRREAGLKKQEKRIADLGFRRKLEHKTQRDFDAEAAAAVTAHGGKSLLERIKEGEKDKKKSGSGH